MTPPAATIVGDVSNESLLSQQWLAGTFATSTEFRPAVNAAPDSRRFHYVPVYLSGLDLEPTPEPFESISSQVLFAPDESAPIPSSESTEAATLAAQWIEPIVQRLDDLLALPADWDHHGAPPIAVGHVLPAFQFLREVMRPNTPPPAVVPVSDGGIQLEWHRAGFDVELLIADRGPEELYVCEIESGREWEGPAVAGFAEHDLAERLAD